jgi:hypothetical protein
MLIHKNNPTESQKPIAWYTSGSQKKYFRPMPQMVQQIQNGTHSEAVNTNDSNQPTIGIALSMGRGLRMNERGLRAFHNAIAERPRRVMAAPNQQKLWAIAAVPLRVGTSLAHRQDAREGH